MKIANLKQQAALAGLLIASASAQAVPLINEGFDNVGALVSNGWVLTNESSPLGSVAEAFFQGDDTFFAAQAGAANSFAASNFNVGDSAPGATLSAWLITPTFSTATDVSISFWARADLFSPFFDSLTWGVSSGGSATSSFTLGPSVTVAGDWTQYTVNIASGGLGSTARFAMVYTGLQADANYIGIDSLSINAVPEPTTWLLFSAGLAGLAGVARRRQRSEG